MARKYSLREKLGTGLGAVGNFFKLPELGISENIAGNNYSAAGVGRGATPTITPQQLLARPGTTSTRASASMSPIPSSSQPLPVVDPLTNQNSGTAITGARTGSRIPSSTFSTATSGDVFSDPIATPRYVDFNGMTYNINDPAQRQAFMEARDATARTVLGDASTQQARELESINMDLQQLGLTEQDYLNDYNRNIEDLNESYDLGTVNRSNYYAQLSPNAFQSSQGDAQQYSNNQRLQGLGDLDTALNQTTQEIDLNRQALTREQQDLANAYNQFTSGIQNNLSVDPENYTSDNTISDFSFDRQVLGPVDTKQVDLSAYTPYTNFQQLGQSPEANYFKNPMGGGSQGLSAKDNYLGYRPNQKEKDYINSYLKRGY